MKLPPEVVNNIILDQTSEPFFLLLARLNDFSAADLEIPEIERYRLVLFLSLHSDDSERSLL